MIPLSASDIETLQRNVDSDGMHLVGSNSSAVIALGEHRYQKESVLEGARRESSSYTTSLKNEISLSSTLPNSSTQVPSQWHRY